MLRPVLHHSRKLRIPFALFALSFAFLATGAVFSNQANAAPNVTLSVTGGTVTQQFGSTSAVTTVIDRASLVGTSALQSVVVTYVCTTAETCGTFNSTSIPTAVGSYTVIPSVLRLSGSAGGAGST